jgi:predicted transcriptional regulator YdeE
LVLLRDAVQITYRAFRFDRIETFREQHQQFEPHKITLEAYFERCRQQFIPPLDIPLSQAATTFASSPKQLTMKKLTVAPFKLIGITVRTSNADPAQTAKDIGGLWNRLLAESLIAQIPNKVDATVYSAYTDFESDQTGAYTTLLGCRVASIDRVPEGMEAIEVKGGNYQQMTCRGDLAQGVVYGAWTSIWGMGLKRVFTTDYEVYGPKALNPSDAEVDIFVAVK